MSTLLVSEIFPPKIGGSGRWLWEIYRRFDRKAVVIAGGQDPDAVAFDESHDLDVERLPLTFPNRFVRRESWNHYRLAYRELKALARRHDVRSLHTARGLPEGLLAIILRWRTGVPYTCYAHGEEVNLSNEELCPAWHNKRVYGSRELGLLVGLVLRNAEKVIANSENTLAILRERWGLPVEKTVLLHPGVDTKLFRPASRDATVRTELGWGDRPVVLTVGRLQKRKGHDVLIQALSRVREHHPDVLYAIVGGGEEESELRASAVALGLENHVLFMGEISDTQLKQCYQQCDLFALPNRQIGGDIEGFGMVLLEAQACGRPVLAGASGGTAETMRIPDTGVVLPCEEPAPLADELTRLLSDSETLDAMGKAGRAWVVEQFDWDALAEKASALFELPLQKRGPA